MATNTDELVPLHIPQSIYPEAVAWLAERQKSLLPDLSMYPGGTVLAADQEDVHERYWTTERLAIIRNDRYPSFGLYRKMLDHLAEYPEVWFTTADLDAIISTKYGVRWIVSGVGLRLSRSHKVPKEGDRVLTPHQMEWGTLVGLEDYAAYRLSPLMAERWKAVRGY